MSGNLPFTALFFTLDALPNYLGQRPTFTASLMATCLLGLGSNLGDRPAHLQQALARLAGTDFTVTRLSRFHASTAIGGPADQDEFLNAAVVADTTLTPDALLARLMDVERQLGRERTKRWAARTIDLDLLLYDDLVRRETLLEIPHPRMAVRRFVLAPAAEIAGDWPHPLFQRTIEELLDHLDSAPNVVALCGPDAVTTGLVQQLERTAPTATVGWTFAENWSPDKAPPKLLLIIHDPAQTDSAAWCDQLEQSLRRQPVCPWLRVDAAPLESACDILAAALQGMRSSG